MKRAVILTLLLAFAPLAAFVARAHAQKSAGANRVFELRTYTTNEGKMPDLHKRFREVTNRMFQKHGMTIIGYWEPQDDKDGKGDKLVYLLAFPSRESAKASWKAFSDDPEWQAAYKKSHENGVLVKKVESVYLDPTDYSPIK